MRADAGPGVDGDPAQDDRVRPGPDRDVASGVADEAGAPLERGGRAGERVDGDAIEAAVPVGDEEEPLDRGEGGVRVRGPVSRDSAAADGRGRAEIGRD